MKHWLIRRAGEGDDGFQIANIAVAPDLQGNGSGRGLHDFAETETETEAGRCGFREMKLATHSALDENLSLYRHLGWTEFERGEFHVRLSKPVPSEK